MTWQGLEALADDGRLKLIKEVKEELERRHPEALARLAAFPRTKMPPKGNDLRRRYQELTAKYQELIPEEDLVYDPADAWLVVAAQKYGYTLVTDELASDVRKTRARHGPPIPDLCRWECVPCMSLRELANHHGWI